MSGRDNRLFIISSNWAVVVEHQKLNERIERQGENQSQRADCGNDVSVRISLVPETPDEKGFSPSTQAPY